MVLKILEQALPKVSSSLVDQMVCFDINFELKNDDHLDYSNGPPCCVHNANYSDAAWLLQFMD